MRAGTISASAANTLASTEAPDVMDDILLTLGDDSDIAMLLRSAILATNTALTGVLIGTPVAEAIAADSLMISNVTASGDLAFYVNKGGHSQMVLWADGSTGDTAIMASASASFDVYIAGTKVLDYATGAFAFQQAVTISSTSTLTLGALTLSGAITGGSQTLNNLGNLGIGDTAANANYIVYADKTFTDTDNSARSGIFIDVDLAKTSAAFTGYVRGIGLNVGVNAANTQNWTGTAGVRGISTFLSTNGSAVGTITGMASIFIDASVAAGADDPIVTNLYGIYIGAESLVGNSRLTNDYGIYIGEQAGGGTLNYAIFVAGGNCDLGGTLEADAYTVGAAGSLTIATGAIAVTRTYHTIVVENGAGAGNDQLDTATGGSEGDILILKPTTSGGSDTVTVADGTGANTFILAGAASFAMDHVDDRIMFIHNGTEWVEISRSSNS